MSSANPSEACSLSVAGVPELGIVCRGRYRTGTSKKKFTGHDLDKNDGERCNSCFCYYCVVNNLRIVKKS